MTLWLDEVMYAVRQAHPWVDQLDSSEMGWLRMYCREATLSARKKARD